MRFGRLQFLYLVAALVGALGVTPVFAGPLAVVGNFTEGYSPGSVAIIDTANDQVVGQLRVGVNPSGVAITPDGKTAVVACAESRDLWFIDLAASPPKLIGSVSVDGDTGGGPFYPVGVAMSPDGQYVALTVGVSTTARANASPGNQYVKIVSVADRAVVQTIQMPQDQVPMTAEAAAFSSKGGIVIVGPQSLTVYGLAFENGQILLPEDTGDATGRLYQGAPGASVAITPDGNTALIPLGRRTLQSVQVTDGGKITLGPQLPSGGDGAQSIAITADGAKAYVRNFFAPQSNISVFQVGAGGTLKDTNVRLSSSGFPALIAELGALFVGVNTVAVTPDGKKVYATNPFLNTVEVFEGDNPAPVKRFATGANPFGVAIQPR
jgi:DNA-binding beta-propeller fold protein YncE